jgi:L-fuculose-phosphate aldolase
LASGGDLEREARKQIVEYCRLLWDRRLVTGTSGNVSVRLEGGDLIVTPTLRSLRALREDELVRTDASGKPRAGQGVPTSELPLHIAAYAARADVRAVVHTHPTFCVVWSKTGAVFERDTVGARETLGEVAFTPYAPPGSLELARVTAEQFERGINTVLMERHGVSAVGPGLEDAFVLTDLAEEAARIACFGKFLLRE